MTPVFEFKLDALTVFGAGPYQFRHDLGDVEGEVAIRLIRYSFSVWAIKAFIIDN